MEQCQHQFTGNIDTASPWNPLKSCWLALRRHGASQSLVAGQELAVDTRNPYITHLTRNAQSVYMCPSEGSSGSTTHNTDILLTTTMPSRRNSMLYLV